MRGGDERIGKLRDKVTILAATRTEDPVSGEVLATFAPLASNLPASVTSSQTEVERGKKLSKVTTFDVLIRYREDLRNGTANRLLIEGMTCEIKAAVDPTRRRRWLRITAVSTD
jgi:SPP1 family predicted phage head-tail adaptor